MFIKTMYYRINKSKKGYYITKNWANTFTECIDTPEEKSKIIRQRVIFWRPLYFFFFADCHNYIVRKLIINHEKIFFKEYELESDIMTKNFHQILKIK